VDLIAGQFELPAAPEGVLDNRSPADLSHSLGQVPFAAAQVERAVAAARQAQRAWGLAPLAERLAAVKRIGAALEAHKEALARAIALDVGKPLWEARTEVAASIAKAQVTCDEGMALVRGFVPGPQGPVPRDPAALEPRNPLAAAPPFEALFRPLGVLAVLGPFNFPVHLPNGHILPALATGNAVVFKPSEVAPHAAEVYARAVESAGLPPGIFNVVQGGGRIGAALAADPDVDGVLFTGSWGVGQAIEAATHGHGKMLALEMGGKNAALVLDDALAGPLLDKALYDVLFSAFVSAGQRCTATSRCVVQGPASRADEFARRLARLAGGLVVGHPLEDGVFMGPLASEAALRKFEQGLSSARSGGYPTVALPVGERHAPRAQIEEVLAAQRVRPRSAGRELDGCYISPAVHRVHLAAGSPYEREELFGPDVAVYSVATEEEAVALANSTDYGLAASVHTADPARFARCLAGLACGVVNHNAPTVGASGRLPFGGLKRSGNHRPAALFSTLYCTAAVAVMRGEGRLDTGKLAPGVRWTDEQDETGPVQP
jgi:succinylglutamic semialdehyde dehydrogenase